MTERACGRRSRAGLAGTAIIGLTLSLASCGAPSPGSRGAVLQNVKSSVFQAINAWGLPITSGSIGCQGPIGNGSVRCYGLTDNTPVFDVSANFRPRDGHYRPSGCPGRLSIVVNNTSLAELAEDPCK